MSTTQKYRENLWQELRETRDDIASLSQVSACEVGIDDERIQQKRSALIRRCQELEAQLKGDGGW